MDTYIADFETTTDPNDCRVWAYAICQVGNEDNIILGNNIDDFMSWCAHKRNNYKVLFHNLKFDSQALLSWLFKNGFRHTIDKKDRESKTFNTLISDKGLYYQIEVIFERKGKMINKVVFQDSAKLLDMSVKKIAETFKLPFQKLELDYDEFRPVGHELTEHEKEYITHDVKIVAHAVKYFYDHGLNKMTIGSCALDEYREIIKQKNFERFFPEPSYDYDVRQSYKGGFTYLNPKFAGKTVREGVALDYNSVYPSIMKDELLPYGKPIYFAGKYEYDDHYPIYIQMIRCQFELKPGKIPMIQIRHGSDYRANEYLESSNDMPATLCLTSVDLELFLDQYNIYNMEYMGGWKFKATRGLFDEYVDKWYEIKVRSKREKNWGMYEISKRMLNALYGKFGTLPKIVSKIPGVEDGRVVYKGEYTRFNGGVYIGMATFITSYARSRIVRAAQTITDNYNDGRSKIEFIYADTDSLWLKSKGHELPRCFDYSDEELGMFKVDGEFKRGKWLRQKCYIADYRKPGEKEFKLKVTVAGMPESCYKNVTFNNFKIGASYDGKLEPYNVPGGVVLRKVDFTIKRL